MKVTLTHDGKSVELDLTAEQMTALGLKEEKKKTGYERATGDGTYYYINDISEAIMSHEISICADYGYARVLNGNYYTDRDLAKANARADKLMRQLRRFAAENGGIPSVEDWKHRGDQKHTIIYDYDNHLIKGNTNWSEKTFGGIYFTSEKARDKAIEKFHDELIWYFTEYEAMLR